jgi:hypothetical protein
LLAQADDQRMPVHASKVLEHSICQGWKACGFDFSKNRQDFSRFQFGNKAITKIRNDVPLKAAYKLTPHLASRPFGNP